MSAIINNAALSSSRSLTTTTGGSEANNFERTPRSENERAAPLLAVTSSNPGSSESPRRKPRAQSGSPSRPAVNAQDVQRILEQRGGGGGASKPQHHVAFLDQSSDDSPTRRFSAANPHAPLRPAYFSQVTLQPQRQQTTSVESGSDKTQATDIVTYDEQLAHSDLKTKMNYSLLGDDRKAPSSNFSRLLSTSSDVTDAPPFTLFTPLYQNGNAKVQLQRSINLYQAKLKKARRKREEEQVENEKALNAYLRSSLNAVSDEERFKRKEEFQRRRAKHSTNIQHLEKKIDEYKGKIDRLTVTLAASAGSSGTSDETHPAAPIAMPYAENENTITSNPEQQQRNENNKWKSATLPPGYVMPQKDNPATNSSKLSKAGGTAGNVFRKATAPVTQLLGTRLAGLHSAHYSASSANLDRLEAATQQQHATSTKRDNASTATVGSGDSSTSSQPSSVQLVSSSTVPNRLREGKMALSLRDSASSVVSTANNNNKSKDAAVRGKSKDDSALGALGKALVPRAPAVLGSSTSGGYTTAISTNRGQIAGTNHHTTRWYHNALGENSKDNNERVHEHASNQHDDEVSVSSLGTGSRGGTSAGDSNEIILRQRFELLMHELGDLRSRFDECNSSFLMLREHNDNQYAKLTQTLEENLWKTSALESQLADVVELRRADVDSWRHAVEEMEERISYQIRERMHDMQENVDRLDTRFSLMEHTQAREKALLSLESIQNSTTQQMLFKLLNLVLAVLQFIIVLGSSVAAMIAPVFESKMSFFAATLVVAVAVVVVNSIDDMSDLLHPRTFVKTCINFMLFRRADDRSDDATRSLKVDSGKF